jgi:Fic family protein
VKSCSEVHEILAVAVARKIAEIISSDPKDINVTPEWICRLHKDVAGSLFPEWAGRFRDVNVQVGSHTPPPFCEVPVYVRLYCDDLATRLSNIIKEKDAGEIVGLLAWADWRFQWIHPFKDFNGRVGRILLSAILFKLKLPPTETASVEPNERRRYLDALRSADSGDMTPLIQIWMERISAAVRD